MPASNGPLPGGTDGAFSRGSVRAARYRHDRRRVGWDLRVDGSLITAGQEPLHRLDGTVDLDRPDARYGLVLRGTSGTAYVDQGDGWEFLFAYDTAEVIDSTDPAVRAQYRYGVGARLDPGTITVDRLEARRTEARRPR